MHAFDFVDVHAFEMMVLDVSVRVILCMDNDPLLTAVIFARPILHSASQRRIGGGRAAVATALRFRGSGSGEEC